MRLRIVRALTVLLLVGAAVGLVVRSALLIPGGSQSGAATPTNAPLGPMLFLSNVSYGTLTLNGTPLAGSPPLVATFRRGLNTITLTAPPFRPMTCHVQWPSRQNDGACAFPPTGASFYSVGGRPVSPALIVVLPFSLDALSSAAQSQVLTDVTNALQSAPPQTNVPSGEYIATGQDASGTIVSRRTKEPLQADLLAVATSLGYVSDTFCSDPNCASGVPLGTGATDTRGEQAEWVVTADVALRWQFRSGTSVVANSKPSSVQLPESLLLTYDARQGWALDQNGTAQLVGYGLPSALAQNTCNIGFNALYHIAQHQGDSLGTLHDSQLQGCEFTFQTAQGADVGHYIVRFGVLLAADANAHALEPSFPSAPESALAAVGD